MPLFGRALSLVEPMGFANFIKAVAIIHGRQWRCYMIFAAPIILTEKGSNVPKIKIRKGAAQEDQKSAG